MNIHLLGHGSRYEVCKNTLLGNGHELVELNECDLIVMANHNQILPKEIFNRPKYGAINLHAGRLPQYRGSSPLNWQIINGETKIGISIIQVDEGVDTGSIWAEKTFDISLKDTIVEVRETADKLFSKKLLEVILELESGNYRPAKQIEIDGIRGSAYWHHRKPEDSEINCKEMTAKQVYDLVRASEPPYQAYVVSKRALISIEKEYVPVARLLPDSFYGVSGRVVKRIGDGVVVICKDKGLWLNCDLKIGQQLV